MKAKIFVKRMLSNVKKAFMAALFLIVTLTQGHPQNYQLYPYKYDLLPAIKSPCIIDDSLEVVIVSAKDGKYGIIPVTMENGKPLLYSYKLGTLMGKDGQLQVASGDFPLLAETGLHSEVQLDKKEMITGIPINIINCTARPDAYSYAGFIAEDEDIISVLKGDNDIVRKLGLTHPQLAKPLFHIWNIILKETELGNWARFYDNIQQIYYNGNILFFKASGSKGWQVSIFFDEVQGRYNIHVDRKITDEENKYIEEKYSHLDAAERIGLIQKISNLDFSEMAPYYIMRYGFYEGHTEYRCDPVAISFIFGLKSLSEIDKAFKGELYSKLTGHFVSE